MKLITFRNTKNQVRAGWLNNTGVVDMNLVSDGLLPDNMLDFIDDHEHWNRIILDKQWESSPATDSLSEVKLLAPLPNPRSIRDYIGFEQHMLNASATFGHKIGKAWYDMPIFYFTNHHAVYGPDDEIRRPPKETRMDIELELACIIGKTGVDIPAAEAEHYIFGYTIFNDWTARAIQAKEMEVPLGPHKGKDFANAFGPCIVTRDEINRHRGPEGRLHLAMTAKINGQLICEGNYGTVYYTFDQMIERASENGVVLYPGDILGSGTVGWGSLVENNFSVHRPLEPGDLVELEIEGIGILRNKVI